MNEVQANAVYDWVGGPNDPAGFLLAPVRIREGGKVHIGLRMVEARDGLPAEYGAHCGAGGPEHPVAPAVAEPIDCGTCRGGNGFAERVEQQFLAGVAA